MNNHVTINIEVQQGGIVNINTYPTPYRTVIDASGMPHTFYSKEDYQSFVQELHEQR